ncbi:AraC family transcriptional regulator [Coraliomargarita sp. SDUM461004]|uniref:AraC family transcriptional regulator n=1 Tax=Thalassobacterium sedimentorum TaxID=3041258 RepID=A0ABU1AHQ0_9BACT|nr:AraC family transcriptional regulator [Coraliomargarita sp. SDUM461004]MDQ8194119.1 AraC family transcriptional regulator [Coraliomargarita sp. SDUM461004]
MHSIAPSAPRYEKRSKAINCCHEVHEARLPVFDCIYHFHPEIELIAIHSSHGICLIDGHLERFQAGDVFLISSNVPHSFTNRLRDSTSDSWTHYTVLHLLPSFLGTNTTLLPELSRIRNLLNEQASRVLMGKLRKHVSSQIRQLFASSQARSVLHVLDILVTITENLELTQSLKSMEQVALHGHEADRLARVHRFINDHSTESLSLETVASCASMAPSSFSRFFHQKTGKTFQEHLAEVRILDACSRLILTDASVTNICYDSGFNNLSNFNRQFRRIKRTTPSEFRNAWKQEEVNQGRDIGQRKMSVSFENKDFRVIASE